MEKRGSVLTGFIIIILGLILAASAVWYWRNYRDKDLRVPAPVPYSLDQVEDIEKPR